MTYFHFIFQTSEKDAETESFVRNSTSQLMKGSCQKQQFNKWV